MNNTQKHLVLAGTAIFIVGAVIVGLCISPIAAVGLPACLAAVAAIVRAVAGDSGTTVVARTTSDTTVTSTTSDPGTDRATRLPPGSPADPPAIDTSEVTPCSEPGMASGDNPLGVDRPDSTSSV